MNKKLKYGAKLIILTSVITSQNIDAAYLWQRIKDIAQQRWASALGSAGLGYYAATAQDTKYKILASLCATGLAAYACSAPDTSSLEGLVAKHAGRSIFARIDIANDHAFPVANAIADMKRDAGTNAILIAKIDDLNNTIYDNMKYNKSFLLEQPQYRLNGQNELNDLGKKEWVKLDIAALHLLFDTPSKIQEHINHLKEIHRQQPQ